MVDFTNYDLKNAKANDFDPLPAGEYQAVVVDMEEKPTKDGTGKRLNVKLQIVTPGQYMNRTVFDGINIVNKSEQAQKIGRGQLKALCIAAGVPDPQNSQQLYGKKIVVKLGISKDDKGNERNEVKSYKAFVASSAPPAAKRDPNMIEQAFGEGEAAPAEAASGAKVNPWA